jgi:phosphate transport system substrate-binding protein
MERSTSQRHRRTHLSLRSGFVAALVGAATVVAATGSITGAGASTAKAAPSLVSLEKQLTTLEAPPSTNVTVTENGSSLFTPLFQLWGSSPISNITLQPTVSSSGTGQSDAINGTANIGASDPYLTPVQLQQDGVINVPVAVSAQQVNYNIPGLKQSTHLHLNAAVLNSIYTGEITTWNNSAISKLNPGVKIPSIPIITLHRSDNSGDTFLFTSYLSAADPSSFVASQGGPSQSPTWPNVPGELAAKGNAGMLTTCAATPGCIAYIGISYLNNSLADNLGYALLENHAKQFVGPWKTNIAAEVASFQHIPSNAVISLIYSSSKSAKIGYPIVNFEYAIVKTNQASLTTAQAIKALLAWGMDPRYGSSSRYLPGVQFQALAPNALAVAIGLLNQIN